MGPDWYQTFAAVRGGLVIALTLSVRVRVRVGCG